MKKILLITLILAMTKPCLGIFSVETIHDCVLNNDLETLKKIVKKYEDKIDIDGKDEYGNTPFLYAASYGDIGMLRYLLKKGADINFKNKKGNTPLSIAVFNHRSPEIIELLVKKGAKVNKKILNTAKERSGTKLERQIKKWVKKYQESQQKKDFEERAEYILTIKEN